MSLTTHVCGRGQSRVMLVQRLCLQTPQRIGDCWLKNGVAASRAATQMGIANRHEFIPHARKNLLYDTLQLHTMLQRAGGMPSNSSMVSRFSKLEPCLA